MVGYLASGSAGWLAGLGGCDRADIPQLHADEMERRTHAAKRYAKDPTEICGLCRQDVRVFSDAAEILIAF